MEVEVQVRITPAEQLQLKTSRVCLRAYDAYRKYLPAMNDSCYTMANVDLVTNLQGT